MFYCNRQITLDRLELEPSCVTMSALVPCSKNQRKPSYNTKTCNTNPDMKKMFLIQFSAQDLSKLLHVFAGIFISISKLELHILMQSIAPMYISWAVKNSDSLFLNSSWPVFLTRPRFPPNTPCAPCERGKDEKALSPYFR